MKNALTALIAALAFAGAAQATETSYPTEFETVTSTVSRAQVEQELAAARAHGDISNTEETQIAVIPAPVTRAQIKSELARAKAQGVVTFGEEDYPPVHG